MRNVDCVYWLSDLWNVPNMIQLIYINIFIIREIFEINDTDILSFNQFPRWELWTERQTVTIMNSLNEEFNVTQRSTCHNSAILWHYNQMQGSVVCELNNPVADWWCQRVLLHPPTVGPLSLSHTASCYLSNIRLLAVGFVQLSSRWTVSRYVSWAWFLLQWNCDISNNF